MKKSLLIITFLLSLCMSAQIYVDASATGNNDGSSWANAYTDLQTAIQNAAANDNIWIAAGIYSPGSLKSDTFNINVTGVSIYGGFAGTETNLSQRNIAVNEVTLSGDVNNDDTGLAYFGVNRQDNNIHVVTLTGTGNIRLDGITVSGGNADDTSSAINQEGSAILIDTNNVTIENCTIEKNLITRAGVVQSVDQNGVLNIINTTFSENFGNSAVVFYGRASGASLDVNFTNCLIKDNVLEAVNGSGQAGMFWYRQDNGGPLNATFTNCTLVNNTNNTNSTNATLINASRIQGTVEVYVYNSIFNNNTKANGSIMTSVGRDISGQTTANTYQIENSISEDGFSNIPNTNGWVNRNNSTIDPLFVSSTDFSLQSTSPAVNNGDDAKIPANITTDIDGNARIQSSQVDIGCYETAFTTLNSPFNVVYVDQNATGNNDGSSWIDAITNLQTALDNYTAGTQIWVTAGTYKPVVGGGGRFNTFTIAENLTTVYGGFSGTENVISERDLSVNQTILSGDANDNDTGVDYSGVNRGENLYQIVTIDSESATLDGFVFSGGQADSGGASTQEGAAISMENNFTTARLDIKIRNSIFENNVCSRGGIIRAVDKYGLITLENNIFRNNLAVFGTVLYLRSGQGNGDFLSFTAENCLFENNINRRATGIGQGGIIWFRQDQFNNSSGTITNCTFVNNRLASTGDANAPLIALKRDNGGLGRITVNNSIFYNNLNANNVSVRSLGNDTGGTTGAFTVNNSLSPDQFANVTSNNNNTISGDPLFTDLANGDYTLMASSPAINSGDNQFVTQSTDLLGNMRIQGTTVDMGVYESNVTAGINDVEELSLNLYPNPVSDILHVTVGNYAFAKAEVYNLQGQRVGISQTKEIYVEGLKTGMYIIKVITQNGDVASQQFIKK